MKNILHEPLVHFTLAGALIFTAYALLDSPPPPSSAIVISQGNIEQLISGFSNTWQRRPTAQETEELLREHIREEVYYREAMALGLDRDDSVIRRRLRQKMEFLSADLADAQQPDEATLQGYLLAHGEQYRSSNVYSFEQVFLSAKQPAAQLQQQAEQLLAQLNRADSGVSAAELGERSLLPQAITDADQQAVAAQFGQAFAESLASLPVQQWQGPLTSAYGMHLVRLTRRGEGQLPALAAIRPAVERDWRNEQQRRVNEEQFRQLLARYPVSIEGADAASIVPRPVAP